MVEPRDIATAMEELRGTRSQKEVAEKGGMSADHWSRLKQGKTMPRAKTRAKIAKGLGVTPERFWEAVNEAWKRRLATERQSQAVAAPDVAEAPTPVYGSGSALFEFEEHLNGAVHHIRALAHLLLKAASAR